MEHERWFGLALAVLATWRVTHLIAEEDGPWDAIAMVRGWVGSGFLGKLMDCFYCLSLWVAAPLAYLAMNRWSEWPVLWLALSGAACLLERLGKESMTTHDIQQHERREGED